MSADEEYITFAGGSAEEAEDFILAIKRRAYSKGKHIDNTWIAHFVSVCLERKALRWFETLDQQTQSDWNLLKRAILEEYNEPSFPSTIVPTSPPALNSYGQGSIPAAAPPFRIGRVRVECNFSSLQGYIARDSDSRCVVASSQSSAAIFEFCARACTLKFQSTAEDYLGGRLSHNLWESSIADDNFATVAMISGQTAREDSPSSNLNRVDLWSLVDENRLAGRWTLTLGGFRELEATGCLISKGICLARNYQRFTLPRGRGGYKPLTLYFEYLS